MQTEGALDIYFVRQFELSPSKLSRSPLLDPPILITDGHYRPQSLTSSIARKSGQKELQTLNFRRQQIFIPGGQAVNQDIRTQAINIENFPLQGLTERTRTR